MMLAAGVTMATDGPHGFTITLARPFPPMLSVLGKPNAPVPFIMPARVVAAGGDGRIKDVIGPGPFTFQPDGWSLFPVYSNGTDMASPLAASIQEECYRLAPSVMWGQFSRPAAYRSRLENLIQSAYPIFWNVELASA